MIPHASSAPVCIYLDLEYCYPGMTRESGRPDASQQRQVVQIAAIRFDHTTGQEVSSFNVLTRPPYTWPLPAFFVELTAITDEMVAGNGIAFMDGLRQLKDFSEGLEIRTFDKDFEVLRQNTGYYQAPFPFEGHPFVRVKSMLSGWGLDENAYSSGTLYQAAGLRMDGHVHNALHDVRSMAATVHHFVYS